MFIGTDNFRAGQESGKRIADLLKGHGDIAVVTIPGQLNLDERVRGVNEALKKYPGIKVVQTLDDKVTQIKLLTRSTRSSLPRNKK